MTSFQDLNSKRDFNWVADVLFQHPRDKTALMIMNQDEEIQKISYGGLISSSMRYANLMWDEGIHAGDTVLIIMKMIPDLWYLTVGAAVSGVVYSPAPILLNKSDIEYRIEQTGAKAIFTDSDTRKMVMEAAKGKFVKVFDVTEEWFQDRLQIEPDHYAEVFREPEEPHAIFFTSGTEGRPKVITHNGYYPLGHVSTAQWLGLKDSDIHWNISSPGWAKWAWSNLYAPLVTGSTSFAFEQGRFSAERSLMVLANYPITSLCTAPTVWRMFMLQDLNEFKPMSLNKCSSAGEPLNPEIISKWEKVTGIRIRDGYGQSESTAMVGNLNVDSIRPGSAGKPLLQYDIRIVNDQGKEVPAGTEGNIAVKMENKIPGLFLGYGNDKELNNDRFRNGYYYTGDLGKKDNEGYIWFVSRADDVIKASDYRIGPFEVESALLTHHAVAESAVVGSPDKIRGDVVKAFVVLRNGYEPTLELARELSFHVKVNVAPYMRPKRIEFVTELPKTISGKIIRKQLRRMELDAATDGSTVNKGTFGGYEFNIP